MSKKPGQRARTGIKDVAQATGPSIATFSNALTGKRGVSDEVRLRVHTVAERLGCSASPIARAMRRPLGRHRLRQRGRGHAAARRPYLLGAQNEAAVLGEILMIVNAHQLDAVTLDPQIEALLRQRVDGLILASTTTAI